MAVHPKDKLYFHSNADPKEIAKFAKRLIAGETAEAIRASERGKKDSPVVTEGYVVEGAAEGKT